MTCCVCGTGVRGLEQMVDNRMNHATTHATAHAKKNAQSEVQSSGILNVTRIDFLSPSSNVPYMDPSSVASTPFFGVEVRLLTYIRSLTTASFGEAGP